MLKTTSAPFCFPHCLIATVCIFQLQLAVVFPNVVVAQNKELQQADEENQKLSPADAVSRFKVPADLRVDLCLSEPEIAQPVFCNFDERGRLWVVEYRQYPEPAGLKVVSKDRYYRNVYDKIPEAPPNHVRGADRISIHEDTNGDGKFDSHKTFVDGLNIVTSVCRGRGGVWVLNPPYLLFYPDKDGNDIPDGDPVVHLSGFGLEDTHSCTNSLRWGPDGWLYASQGSTVSGNIIRPGIDKKPVRSMGQLIWRYHPERKVYEIFAEGGGNAFGVEIDSAGRVFSGHNGGNTRGFHYPQGGYLQKGFTKHGALSNPYAFGYFPQMKHPAVQRFTHNFIIYEAEGLPSSYRGKLFGIEPLQGRVVETEITPRGSTFETRDLNYVLTTPDSWFTPVDIKLGPDGGIYVCDWFDDNVSHLEASVGKTDKADGRIYRLIGNNQNPIGRFDFSKMPSPQVTGYLQHSNRWFRQTALRILGDRKDKKVLPDLKKLFQESEGQPAVEALWATYQIGGVEQIETLDPLRHPNPQVRKWAVRLYCDEGSFPSSKRSWLREIIENESSVETRTQWASSAKRLPAEDCLEIVQHLLKHESDSTDPYQPLLIWWAIESKCAEQDAVLQWIQSVPDFWKNRIVQSHLAGRLVKRFTLPGTEKDMLALSELLKMAHATDANIARQMLKELEATAKTVSHLVFPENLLTMINQLGGASLELQVRQRDPQAIQVAIERLTDSKTKAMEKTRLIVALGDIRDDESLETLIQLFKNTGEPEVQIACLGAFRKRETQPIGQMIIDRLPDLNSEVQEVALAAVVSRAEWTLNLLNCIDGGKCKKSLVSSNVARRMLFHDHPEIRSLVGKVFGEVKGATDAVLRSKIDVFWKELQNGNGSPYEGKKLFVKHCGKCHRLYQNGGDVGPNLTAYQRNDVKGMLLHIVNPNAEIREGYENILFLLDDGRVVSGFVKDEGKQTVVVRTAEALDVRLLKSSIEAQKAVPQSLMPTGLLDVLTAQQRRDLFAFLRSTQPLNN